jgi:hypothetical protein
MQQGMNVLLEGDFQAAAIVLHRVAAASTAELGAAAHNHRSLGH